MTMPGRLMTSGMIWCSRSMNVITTIAQQNRNSTRKSQGGAELHEQEQGQQAVNGFDNGVLGRNGGTAGAAFPSQNQVAENGNIIVPGNFSVTCRAVGRREDNRHLFREPVDAHIQERADYRTENEDENVDCYRKRHKTLLCTARGVPLAGATPALFQAPYLNQAFFQ